MPILMKAFVLWCAILIFAIFNGIVREKVLFPACGSSCCFALSGVLLGMAIFLVAFWAAPWYGVASSPTWLGVGAFWLALTLAFEFSFGILVQHKTWTELLGAYTFQHGNIWPLVLASIVIAPWLAARLRGLIV